MADLTYRQLRRAVTDLGKDVTRASEAIRGRAQQIHEEAEDTGRVAELIRAMGVDTATTAETTELSKIMAGMSQAANAYAAAANTTARQAVAAHEQAVASHDGINEAYNRAPVDVSDLKPAWLQQQ